MDWPANPLWDYALELYRRAGVEAACLELQERHGLDVNMVLFCCWLAHRGIQVERGWLEATVALAERWQSELVRPLRALRRRLKADLADPRPGSVPAQWPTLTAALRRRALALEIDGERLEQLLLAERAADLPATAAPGIRLAGANLRCYWRFAATDRDPLGTLLHAAFPEVPAEEVAAALHWLGD